MSDADLGDLAARADLSRLLAACYYEPGPELAEERVFESMLVAAREVDGDLAERTRRLGSAHAGTTLEELLVDYTRLFLGPVQPLARPYGSAWLSTEQSVMQDVTMSVLDLYAEGGFEMADDFRDLPDHISAQLEFLYMLLFRAAQARRSADDGAEEAATIVRGRLLREHLGRWTAPFCAAIEAGAQTSFYRELAGVTARFVELEERGLPGVSEARAT